MPQTMVERRQRRHAEKEERKVQATQRRRFKIGSKQGAVTTTLVMNAVYIYIWDAILPSYTSMECIYRYILGLFHKS